MVARRPYRIPRWAASPARFHGRWWPAHSSANGGPSPTVRGSVPTLPGWLPCRPLAAAPWHHRTDWSAHCQRTFHDQRSCAHLTAGDRRGGLRFHGSITNTTAAASAPASRPDGRWAVSGPSILIRLSQLRHEHHPAESQFVQLAFASVCPESELNSGGTGRLGPL